MRARNQPFAIAAAILIVASGCLRTNVAPHASTPAILALPRGLVPFHLAVGAATLEGAAASGNVSEFRWSGPAASIEVPANVFRFDEQRFSAAHTFQVATGETFHLLVPPGMTNLTLRIGGQSVAVPTPRTDHGLFRTEDIIDWFKVQRDQFPRRCDSCPNYKRSQPYFAGLFRSFGMATVEIDPYGGSTVMPDLANVVAYKYSKLDTAHPLWIGMGGHYDAVTATVEAAFDDTSGSLVTLELSKVFANITTQHNMVFGLWGGEETGLRGSAFWTKTNPNIVAQMQLYVNHDADAFSWPGPLGVAKDGSTPDCPKPTVKTRAATEPSYCPDPALVTAGPDGPVADSLLAFARDLQRHVVVGYPDPYFIYEGVAQGQATGYARINAQSDHTAFIAAGVPSVFLINANIETTHVGYHNQADTFANYTKYMLRNQYVDMEEELSAQDQQRGEELMMDSFDTYLWLTFYMVLYEDLGLYNVGTG